MVKEKRKRKGLMPLIFVGSAFIIGSLFAKKIEATDPIGTKNGRLIGNVRDENGRPLNNVDISVENLTTKTDLNGDYSLNNISSGVKIVNFKKINFNDLNIPNIEIKSGKTTELDAQMISQEIICPNDVLINGTITNIGEPIVNADVGLFDAGGNLLHRDPASDVNGRYTIIVPADEPPLNNIFIKAVSLIDGVRTEINSNQFNLDCNDLVIDLDFNVEPPPPGCINDANIDGEVLDVGSNNRIKCGTISFIEEATGNILAGPDPIDIDGTFRLTIQDNLLPTEGFVRSNVDGYADAQSQIFNVDCGQNIQGFGNVGLINPNGIPPECSVDSDDFVWVGNGICESGACVARFDPRDVAEITSISINANRQVRVIIANPCDIDLNHEIIFTRSNNCGRNFRGIGQAIFIVQARNNIEVLSNPANPINVSDHVRIELRNINNNNVSYDIILMARR